MQCFLPWFQTRCKVCLWRLRAKSSKGQWKT